MNIDDLLFRSLGGKLGPSFLPMFCPDVYTDGDVTYLTRPGIAIIGHTQTNISDLIGYLLPKGVVEYADDPVVIPDGAQLIKTAGQTCYQSFGPKRTWNAEAQKYLDHLKESGHWSVFEHWSCSFFIWGISRSLTMEMNRHRHLAISQTSQRYVDEKTLRFVERPEFTVNGDLHAQFIHHIKSVYDWYMVTKLSIGEVHNASRKQTNQAARAVLTNDVEAPAVYTANARTWREILEKRASEGAEVEIRRLAVMLWMLLVQVEPMLFNDFEIREHDGTHILTSPYAMR